MGLQEDAKEMFKVNIWLVLSGLDLLKECSLTWPK